MFGIREACYFYADNYFPMNAPQIDKDYEKKFARIWGHLGLQGKTRVNTNKRRSSAGPY